MIMVMWWRDITTYIMVAWLEKCVYSSTDINTLLFLKKIGFFVFFFVLKEVDFYGKSMQL